MTRSNNKRILLTGTSGFLGKHLSKRLVNEGYNTFLTALHKEGGNHIYEMDLIKIEEVKKIISEYKPTVIIHLGALVNLSRNFEIGLKCIDINLKGTYNLLESLRVYKPGRFIFLSTEEIYGGGNIPFKEDQIPDPPSPYAITKVAAEYLAKIYATELHFSLEIFRVGTMYGFFDFETRFIPQIIIKALRNKPILLNSGMKKRDYVYVDDVVEALIMSLSKKPKEKIRIINVGGGKSFRLKDVVEMILDKTKSRSKVIFGALPDRVGESDEWLLDNHNAEKFLGWKSKTSLSQGLNETIEYYLSKIKR